jgi:hypothetical protein
LRPAAVGAQGDDVANPVLADALAKELSVGAADPRSPLADGHGRQGLELGLKLGDALPRRPLSDGLPERPLSDAENDGDALALGHGRHEADGLGDVDGSTTAPLDDALAEALSDAIALADMDGSALMLGQGSHGFIADGVGDPLAKDAAADSLDDAPADWLAPVVAIGGMLSLEHGTGGKLLTPPLLEGQGSMVGPTEALATTLLPALSEAPAEGHAPVAVDSDGALLSEALASVLAVSVAAVSVVAPDADDPLDADSLAPAEAPVKPDVAGDAFDPVLQATTIRPITARTASAAHRCG